MKDTLVAICFSPAYLGPFQMSLKRFIQQPHFYIIKKTITHYNETLKHGKLFYFCFVVSNINIAHTQSHIAQNWLQSLLAKF